MLSGESILCFAPDPWDDIWRNRHQIMSVLAEQNRVLYVEPRPYLRSVLRQMPDRKWLWSELRTPRLRSVRPGLSVFHPPAYAPLSGRAPLNTWMNALRRGLLRRAMRRLGMERPILWLFRPDMVDVPGRYDESLLIYHIVDEYLGYEHLRSERLEDVRRRERQLIARADLVLVTSRSLLRSKGGLNPNTHWVPNAVNYQAFAEARGLGTEPSELVGVSHPRIGYVGAINDKIDTELLASIAERLPGSLVLVGPVRVTTREAVRGIERLRARSNVRFVGKVPVGRVPSFVAACDMGLLPYRDTEWTRSIHPLKMYEYLACGLPVVSTDIPSVHEEADFIDIARGHDAFLAATARALEDADASLVEKRQARARDNTWHHRVEGISELVQATREKRSLR